MEKMGSEIVEQIIFTLLNKMCNANNDLTSVQSRNQFWSEY